MTYKLFIDDERDPVGTDWIIARTSQEAIDIVKDRGAPSFISFDHDLGGDDTSIKFIQWYIEMSLDLLSLGVDKKVILFPRNFYVHSQNPVGVQNIKDLMKSFINFLDDNQR